MAYAGYGDRASSLGRQTREYGYGLSDIQRASERIGRSDAMNQFNVCLLYTSPSPRDGLLSRMPSSA